MPTRLSHCLLLVAVLAAVSFLQRSKLDTNVYMQLTSIEIVTRENGGKVWNESAKTFEILPYNCLSWPEELFLWLFKHKIS